MKSALITLLALWTVAAHAQDMPLSEILVEGENWQLVADGYQFTDGPCSDADGNFYFTDVAKGTAIHKVDLQGKLSNFIENTPKISGLKFGPEGRLYAATQAPKKQIVAFDKSGKMSVIMDEANPNDLVVTRKGAVYFTRTGEQEIVYIDPAGKHRVVDKGINKPNGITLSPDQGTLVVSDFGGTNLWAFRIEPDGSLAHKAPYMTMRADPGRDVSQGDGMTTDHAGRYYAASELGIQVFDPTGRMCGVIAKPQNKFMASVGFAGPNHEYLYAVCADKVFRRKTQARGVLFFQTPK